MYLKLAHHLFCPTIAHKPNRTTAFFFIPLLLFIVIVGNELLSHSSVAAATTSRNGAINRLLATFHSATPINNVQVVGQSEWKIHKNRVFVGAVNHLYSLSLQNLSLLEDAITGPVMDSPYCNSDLSSCIGPLGRGSIKETNNHNKILHYIAQPNGTSKPGVLLICGSTRQGVCQLRQSHHLNQQANHPNFVGFQHTSVAANSPNASTLSLVDQGGERLYVATSILPHQHLHAYRDSFPAVSTRLGPAGLLPINSGSIEGEAAVYVRQPFQVEYVAGFSHERYMYWASVQHKYVQQTQHVSNPSLTNPLISKLIRVCEDDTTYMSYSEIELQCRSGSGDNTNFNVLKALVLLRDDLVGVFSDGDGKQSAVCIFNMPKIRLTFWYNIDRCRAGTDTIGLPHIGRDSKCINKSHLPLSEDTCQLGVGGTIEASQLAAQQYPDRVLTSLDARIVDDQHALLIAGTNQGQILQMEMSGSQHNRRLDQYADYKIGSGTVEKVQFLDQKHFLAVNGNELSMLKVSMCGAPADGMSSWPVNSSETCETCIASKDPLCGWCLHEGTCLRQSECQSSLLKKCPQAVGAIQPQNISITAVASHQVFVPIKNLPAPIDANKPYECFFGAFKAAPASWSSSGLNCPLPPLNQRPAIQLNSNQVEVTLAIRSASSRASILTHPFIFYNCAIFSVCSMCTTSKWPCKWCAADHKCLNTREEGRETCSSSNESSKCAKIDSQSTPEILIADSTNASVSFGVLNMEESRIKMSENAGLYCTILPSTFSYFGTTDDTRGDSGAQRGVKVQVPAVLQDDRVHCSSAFFNYSAAQPYQNYTLELAMGREMIDKTSVTVYKCSEMASDCSQCLSLDPKWRCTWCEGRCQYHTHSECLTKSSYNNADVLCTQPYIESIQPESGPIEGGTLVEIKGKDLGSRIQDVQDRVLVGGSKCKVTDYEVSKKISCIIERGSGHGPARITIGRTGKRVVESANSQHFHFQDPLPKSIYPVFGPIAGGTRLAIHGDHLNIGSNISVHLDNLPCQVVKDEEEGENSGQITCITSPSARPYTITAIRVQIDEAVRLLHAKFTYRPNPTIKSMDPRSSFESGGRMVNIKGTNFDSILSAKLYLLSSSEEPTELVSQLGLCQIHNSTQMQCQTPKLTLPPSLSSSTYSRWPIGFYMDAVRSVRNLGNTIQLTTVPDPQFSAFKGVKLQSAEQPLVIEGNYLAQAATPEDYIVTVGTESCSVFVLEPHQLLCRLPATQPQATDDLGVELQDGHPLVVVKIGSIRMEIGPLEYDSNSSSMGGLVRMNLLKLVLLLLCALALLLLAALFVLWLWRRRNTEHERVYKRIQMQMEQMESNVRNECKQAFAELQTDMLSDLTAAIDDGVGIPYQNKAEFVSRLLFRESTDTSLLNGYGTSGISAYSSKLPVALAQFDSLLWNRQFIFLFVHMVETDAITASERSTISSLLLASLSRNMVYCTDIILSLLSAHIERICQADNGTGKTAHLLFRKSESLVEKMFQQWLTICMYPYLNDVSGPGKNFFLLYKALKYQTEKGPIDCVTGNARYSLSEQKLLRETVEANPVTLLIIPIDGFDQAPVICKALSCDSISQVKSKLLDLLYKNSPFSTRIANDQFDLEWSCPKRGSILLLDDDRPQVKGLKRLNTLAYYNLPNNSTSLKQVTTRFVAREMSYVKECNLRMSSLEKLLTMQARNGTCHTGHHQSFTFRSGSSDTTCSVWSSAQLIETSNSISPVSNHNHSNCSDPSSNTTYWHLTHPNHNNHDATGENRSKKKARDKGNSLLQKELSMSFNGDSKASARNIPEVFLTRLLMCKGTIQKFVEGFFESVMFVNDSSCCPPAMTDNVPIVMKYVLDFLDEEALRNNVSDPEVVHAWKTNAVVLRLWMQLIHNPDSLFDVQRQASVDGSMVVVGQTLMDAFSRSDVPLGKESPSSKLLFAKEISKYRPIAAQMFRRVKSQQASISNKQFYEYIGAMSRFLGEGLSSTTAVGELLNWVKALPTRGDVKANGLRLVELLEQDPVAVKHRLGERLRQVVHCTIVEPEHIYATLQ